MYSRVAGDKLSLGTRMVAAVCHDAMAPVGDRHSKESKDDFVRIDRMILSFSA